MCVKFPLCNKRPERAPKIFGFIFPLCWRCTAFTISAIVTATWQYEVPILFAFILFLVMVSDGIRSNFLVGGSTNLARVVTGAFGGLGMVNLITLF